MQGLNTTPVHAHTALFGVYGLLSLGLVLVVARLMTPDVEWKEQWLGRAFWAMNVGLGLMVGLSLLPIGVLQAYASIETGLWYARSAEFLQQPLIENLRWLRLVGDTIFLIGVASFAWFMAGLGSAGAAELSRPRHIELGRSGTSDRRSGSWAAWVAWRAWVAG
jgi:nitric oxide reductase subunit B